MVDRTSMPFMSVCSVPSMLAALLGLKRLRLRLVCPFLH